MNNTAISPDSPCADSYSIFYDINDLISGFQEFTGNFLGKPTKRFTNDVYTHYLMYKTNAHGLCLHYAQTEDAEYFKQYEKHFNRLDIAFRKELFLQYKRGQLIADPNLLMLITDITLKTHV